MLDAFLGLDPSPNPSRQPSCAKLGGKSCQEVFLTKCPDFDQNAKTVRTKNSSELSSKSCPLGQVGGCLLAPRQPHPCCVLRAGGLGMGGCGAEVYGQTRRSNCCVNLCCTHGILFPQNSMEKTPFHRRKIWVIQQIGLGYLGFFSKSSPMRWALWAGKLCHV